MRIENIQDIKTYDKNAKIHTKEQLNKIAESIKNFGFDQPVVIDKNGVIIIGHGRFLAARDILNWTEIKIGVSHSKKEEEFIPVILREDLSDLEVKIRRLNDNKLNESVWDMPLLTTELKDIAQSEKYKDLEVELDNTNNDINLTGFDKDLLIETNEKDDEIPEISKEVKNKIGDIYQLGKHRIMCGNSRNAEDVIKLIDKKKVDMIFTDPPYGIDVVKNDGNVGDNRKGVVGFAGKVGARIYDKIIGDDKPFNPKFLLDKASHLIIWGANNFASLLPNYGHWLVWDKKGDMQLKNDFSDCELAWTNFPKKTVKKYNHLWVGMTRKGDRRTELKNRVHPTQKPVGLFVDILNDYSNEKWIILDLFLGSGSTLIACEKTNRICYGMELSEHYVDVIIQRYVDYTGNNKIIKNGKEIVWK